MDHEILLLKLRHLGFKYSAINWFKSYLTDRFQCTRVNGNLSEQRQMSSGVPQGSILGPLLFICYINDLPSYLNDCSVFIYADDTALLVKGKDVDVIQETLTNEFFTITKWFDANKLSVNQKKTNTMLFSGSRSKHKNKSLNVKVSRNSEETLEQVQNFKYLGVELDEHLTFDTHIDKLCRKVKSRAGILWRMRPFITESLAHNLYTSLIHPHFTYGDIVYDACSQQSKTRLQVHQNMALRAVKNVPPYFPTQRLHEQLEINWLDCERKERCCIEAFKSLNNMTSVNVNKLLTSQLNVKETRSSSTVIIKAHQNKTKFGDRNFPNRCEQYWKCLPVDMKSVDKLSAFKTQLKRGNYFEHEH